MVLKVCATKHAVLKCGLKFECYQTCGLKNAVLKVCALFSAVLILYVRSLFCGLLTKNVVLTQRYPKHAVLKVPISQSTKEVKPPPFAQHIFIDLAACHYNLTPSTLIVVAPHSLKLTPNFAIFQKFLFSGRALANPLFLLAQKYPFFNAPELDVY